VKDRQLTHFKGILALEVAEPTLDSGDVFGVTARESEVGDVGAFFFWGDAVGARGEESFVQVRDSLAGDCEVEHAGIKRSHRAQSNVERSHVSHDFTRRGEPGEVVTESQGALESYVGHRPFVT
jgi:hypothetical protein